MFMLENNIYILLKKTRCSYENT